MKLLISLCLVCLPLKYLRLNSPFGYRNHPLTGIRKLHDGVDLRARADTVYAIMNGQVSATGYADKLGIHIRLQHGATQSVYGHLSRVLVSPQDSVSAGEPIGITGTTGRVTGEHLHFSILYWGRYIDPIQFLYQTILHHGKTQKL
ncbi:M23 family metallopeptidase [Mucilaginibacter terrae]|uniref:Murein DD-endopeptidase MepM/ murein hydrolase activator NlpD n=1 Tax=Mucilaginibacter terrae TaxID=1955052 RepID=A0ABU3GNE1_9SPHI|nr:M23 family metallopeptidase [Mucilaginibacter terrae]MDT3401294.1 murein DD-endopeptidase MepM/ murein hydrolase activator NlpD [Mucilaginibacter terrae]